MKLILHILLFCNGMFALQSFDEDFGSITNYDFRRKKRIVWGQVVLKEDQDLYPSTAYQATLISSHYCNEGLLNILKIVLAEHPGNYDPTTDWKINIEHVRNMIFTHCPIDKTRAYCGGAAISEYAVQTACHCIARFEGKARNEFNLPRPYNAWEDMVFLYVGAIGFQKGNTPYVSKNFLVHQKCKQVTNISISHNIGVVVLRYRLQEGTRIAAPTTMVEMSKNWYYTIGKEVVCLIVGWGSVKWEGREVYGLPSFDLRKSWRAMRSFTYCHEMHRFFLEFLFVTHTEAVTYRDIQTWSCSTDFGKLKSAIGHGDSGSPIACENGWYFGVANWGLVGLGANNTEYSIMTDTDIVYAFYENSWNYRPSFNSYIHDLMETVVSPSFRPNAREPKSKSRFAKEEKTRLGPASQSGRQVGDSDFYSLVLLTSIATLFMSTFYITES